MAKRRRDDSAARAAERWARKYERGMEKFFGRPIRPEIVGNYRRGMEEYHRRRGK
jgi:hypothetical protein